ANRLKVGVVPNTLAASAVEARLASMGIPRSAVRIVPMQPFATTATLRDQVRPIEGGIQIAFSVFLCTLGFNGVRAGVNGFVVNKVGRTTGWTQGQVTATCVDVIVLGSPNADLCQDQVSAGVGAGDSGSPVFAIASGNDVQLRGILWGGTLDGTSFVYSPIANIERTDELGPITTCAAGFTC